MTAAGPGGFWSYSREDDEQDGGRIRQLADAVRKEFSLLTGQELRLFIDRDVEWGEEWKSRIDGALATTTFFIPVITPRYFQRNECRRELLTFAGHAKSLGRSDLLMSIYYIPVSGLHDESSSADEAVELVSSMQWDDWRELRLEAPESPAYRKRVNQLAQRLASVRSAEDYPRDKSPVGVAAPAEDEESPGAVELMAEAEEAFPRFNAALEEIASQLSRVTELGENWNPKIDRASSKGAGAALAAFKGFSRALSGPALEIERHGKSFASELVIIDPAILSLIRLVELGVWDADDVTSLADGIARMKLASDEALADLQSLLDMIDALGHLSKDLRVPLRSMRIGVKTVLDARTVLAEWERRMQLALESGT